VIYSFSCYNNQIICLDTEFIQTHLNPDPSVNKQGYGKSKDLVCDIDYGKHLLTKRGDSDILDQKLILTTIVEDSHFYLLIIVNPSLIKEVSTIITS
jgi:hypothetical protein